MVLHGVGWVETKPDPHPAPREGVGRGQPAFPGKQLTRKLRTWEWLLLAFDRSKGRWEVCPWFSSHGPVAVCSHRDRKHPELLEKLLWLWRGSKRGSEVFTGWSPQGRGSPVDLNPCRCPGEVTGSSSCIRGQEGGALSKEAPVWTNPFLACVDKPTQRRCWRVSHRVGLRGP